MFYNCLAVFLVVGVVIFYYKIAYKTYKDIIKSKIELKGGKVISIEEDNSYIQEVDKIEKKNRASVVQVIKARYILEDKEKIMYFVLYHDYNPFTPKSLKQWIDIDA